MSAKRCKYLAEGQKVCQLHNLHCKYPDCMADRDTLEPTPWIWRYRYADGSTSDWAIARDAAAVPTIRDSRLSTTIEARAALASTEGERPAEPVGEVDGARRCARLLQALGAQSEDPATLALIQSSLEWLSTLAPEAP